VGEPVSDLGFLDTLAFLALAYIVCHWTPIIAFLDHLIGLGS